MSAPFPSLVVTATRTGLPLGKLIATASTRPAALSTWTCSSCRSGQQLRRSAARQSHVSWRLFSTGVERRDDDQALPTPKPTDNHQPHTPAATSTTLPSHLAKQRSAFSERVTRLTDSILARASIAGQHINTYTGTDYSGIEALRKEIFDQESSVRERHIAVGSAKDRHTQARAKQASSQKEIVGLLERKASWSPADLERYMSLVRSEHIDDQAVQKAAEELADAERQLEDTRSLLEKLERKQYHEEQIWSDTIRRNSTWVTIGLMGINILLLLAQISLFEPYRRQKIVKEIKETLDEKVLGASEAAALLPQIEVMADQMGKCLHQIDEAFKAHDEMTAKSEELHVTTPVLDTREPGRAFSNGLQGYWNYAQTIALDLFSKRTIQLQKVDVTTIAFEGAAAGAVLTTAVALLILRSTH